MNGIIKGNSFVCVANIKNPTPVVTGANLTANKFSSSGFSRGALLVQTGRAFAVTKTKLGARNSISSK